MSMRNITISKLLSGESRNDSLEKRSMVEVYCHSVLGKASFIHSCVCVCACVHTHIHVCGGQRTAFGEPVLTLLCLQQLLSFCCSAKVYRYRSFWENLRVLLAVPCRNAGIADVCCHIWLYSGFLGLNSGYQACAANADLPSHLLGSCLCVLQTYLCTSQGQAG